MVTLKYSSLKKIAYIIMALPLLVFAFGWLKWYWALIAMAALIAGVYFGSIHTSGSGKNGKAALQPEKEISVSYKTLLIMAGISLVWVWMSGIGGLWGQSDDFVYRNAIYRDIVTREWPVIYPATGHALVYYIGFWLVPALFGKMALLFGMSDVNSLNIAKGAMFIWTAIIIFVIFLLIVYSIKAETKKKQIFIVLFFILFSGMDIWGNLGYSANSLDYHLEWWSSPYQYSSFTTCLFWVYNQALPAWLCILCLINEKNVKNYVFIGMVCLFSTPIPFVGILVYMVFYAVCYLIGYIKEKNTGRFFKDLFSYSNIVSTVGIFPPIAAYLLSNYAISGKGAFRITDSMFAEETAMETGEVASLVEHGVEGITKEEPNMFMAYLSFVLMEFALYMILMWWKYKKKAIYYVTFGSLLIIPMIKIGNGNDFVMRASIPGLVIVFLLVGRFLIEEKEVLKEKGSLKRLTYILLMCSMLIGTITPGMEFYRGTRYAIVKGINSEEYDHIYTLGCDGPYDKPGKTITYGNFVATDIDSQFFFKVFCKKSQ